MNRTILTVVAIVAIAAMMGVTSAYAAPSDKANNDSIPVFKFEPTTSADSKPQRDICGSGFDGLDWEKTRTTTGTIWANGHFKMTIVSEREYFALGDWGGEVIGVETVRQNEQGWFPNDGPVTLQENSKIKCFNGAAGESRHDGETIVFRNGEVHSNTHGN